MSWKQEPIGETTEMLLEEMPLIPPPPVEKATDEPALEEWSAEERKPTAETLLEEMPLAPPPPAEEWPAEEQKPSVETLLEEIPSAPPPREEEAADEPAPEEWLAELITLTVGGRHQMDRIEAQLDALNTWPERLERRLAETTVEAVALREALEDLQKELKRIGRHQLKANTIDETRLERWQEAVKALEAALARREGEVASIRLQQRQAVEAARREWLTTLLPLLDGLEEALTSGEARLTWLKGKHTAQEMEQSQQRGLLALLRQVWGGGPALDREAIAALSAWLDGLRLLRERVWTLLEDAGVRVIPTAGQSFDPHLHVAAGTAEREDVLPGIVVAEQRRGYRLNDDILRFAEVVVSRRPAALETTDYQAAVEPAAERTRSEHERDYWH